MLIDPCVCWAKRQVASVAFALFDDDSESLSRLGSLIVAAKIPSVSEEPLLGSLKRSKAGWRYFLMH